MSLFKKKNQEPKLTVEIDEVAVPEVHTGEVKETELEDDTEEIRYDDVAIPEIHIRRMEKK